MCHDEDYEDLAMWDLVVQCDGPPPSPPPGQNFTLLSHLYQFCDIGFKHNEIFSTPCLDGVVSTCDSSFSDNQTLISKCETGPEALVTTSTAKYRNIYCALCNYIDLKDLNCDRIPDPYVPISWRILVHPLGSTCEEYSSSSGGNLGACGDIQATYHSCNQGEVFDWSGLTCVKLCPAPLDWINGVCTTDRIFSTPAALENCTYVEQSTLLELYSINYTKLDSDVSSIRLTLSNSSKFCTNCSWISVSGSSVTYDGSSVQLLGTNNLKFVLPFYQKVEENYTICLDGQAIIPNITRNRTIFGEICFRLEEEATVITLGISICCLVVMIVAYSLLPNLHNIPGYLVLGQVITLLAAYIFFLLRRPAEANSGACYAVAVITHYFLIATSFWSFLFAVEIIQTITALYAINQRSKKKLFRYISAGACIPLLPILVGIVLDNIDTPKGIIKPAYGLPACWLNSGDGLLVYFLIPMAIIFAANLITYVTVVVKFAILAYQTRKARVNHNEKLYISIKLFFAFGLLWVFGLLAAAYRDEPVLACIFLFLNSLNGLLLLLVFLCNAAVLQATKKYIKELRSEDSSMTSRLRHVEVSQPLTRLTKVNISSASNSPMPQRSKASPH